MWFRQNLDKSRQIYTNIDNIRKNLDKFRKNGQNCMAAWNFWTINWIEFRFLKLASFYKI